MCSSDLYKIDSLKHLERHNPEERVNKLMERMKADFRLSVLPRHIECFDNSNIQGTNPVASCVVFRDGKPAKNDYRHYVFLLLADAVRFCMPAPKTNRRRNTRQICLAILAYLPFGHNDFAAVDTAARKQRAQRAV